MCVERLRDFSNSLTHSGCLIYFCGDFFARWLRHFFVERLSDLLYEEVHDFLHEEVAGFFCVKF